MLPRAEPDVILASDLTLVVGTQAARLTPPQAFDLARELVRQSAAQLDATINAIAEAARPPGAH